MQITAKGGTIVLDYYPIENLNREIYQDEYLRILSFKGGTMNKRIVSKDIMESEVKDRQDNFNYSITDSHTFPQYVSHYRRRELI